MSIQPGTYIGKVFTHAITETKAGDPQAAVTFTIDDEGKQKSLTWFGSFKSPKASEITIKALIACGLKGNNPAGDLEIGKEVQLVVEEEEGQDGKLRTRIRWVNPVGGAASMKKVDPAAAKAKLSSLEGAVMAARQATGINDEEIPF